ncbi:MAG TPA: AcvB/VirJ family lysyl-phosphatidylglycerol hydrolase [Caulobacteraceae bacterium]
MSTGGRFLGAALAAAVVLAMLGRTAAHAQPAAAAPIPDADRARLAHLPLIEVPTLAAGDTFVVLYSGDSGWAATARGFSAELAAAGQPVVGIDALRYFMRRRSPQVAAADLTAVIEHYAAAWSRPRVILVGYSFGADSLPLIVEQLPPEERARVRLMVLISPADRADMLFDGLSWIDLTLPGARPLAPALLTLGAIPAVCIRAEHDRRAACDRFPPQVITSVHLPGFHRYHGQYHAVARIILSSAGLTPVEPPTQPPNPLSR